GEVPEGDYVIEIGKADIKRQGTDITVISYGITVQYALQAAEELAKEGISVHILDLRTIQPLDKDAILEAAAKTGKVLIIHEDNKTGGVGAEVSAIIAEELLFDLDAPIRRLCAPDVPAVGMNPPMEKFFLLSADKIKDAMRELAEF
ncbi:MAG: 2-oxoisovalerate dehydrogenase, partial [Paenibacillus sp.]|nr:2-oxoisovalerate dehydrogenase [Paenibacillus sp.]